MNSVKVYTLPKSCQASYSVMFNHNFAFSKSSYLYLSGSAIFGYVTVNLRMLNKPSLQPFQAKKSRSDDCFFLKSVRNVVRFLNPQHVSYVMIISLLLTP